MEDQPETVKDVVCWGFTAGILARLFDHVGWSVPWNEARIQDLPTHMLPAELSPDDQGLEE